MLDLHAFPGGLDDESRDLSRLGMLGHHDQHLGECTVRTPQFGAIEDVVRTLVVEHRGGAGWNEGPFSVRFQPRAQHDCGFSYRSKNRQAEGQRANWLDIGLQLEGRDDLAHIAIFDHPLNTDAPTSWRVDGQFGVGPARSIEGDWSIEKGTTESIRYQLRVFTGDLNDLDLTNQWVEWGGNPYPYATQLWDMAQEEGKKEKFLEPNEAIEAMTINDGFKVNVWASEPMITQPMAFCWDDRGRMWIAENRDYESRGDGFSNSGDSRILILEDSDQDGVGDLDVIEALD